MNEVLSNTASIAIIVSIIFAGLAALLKLFLNPLKNDISQLQKDISQLQKDITQINEKLYSRLSKLEDKVNALDKDFLILKNQQDRIFDKISSL